MSGVHVRPLGVSDLWELTRLEAAQAGSAADAPYVNRGSLHYFGRSGHSFVAEGDDGSPVGFVLAHSTWQGAEPGLRLERLVTAAGPRAQAVASALAEAVVKSAYDAGVYRLSAESRSGDELVRDALEGAGFTLQDVVTYSRRLGSAGAQVGRS